MSRAKFLGQMVLRTAHDFCQADFALKEKLVFLAQ
jgi:hypothetical protein